MTRTALYRFYGHDGRLLYIGITKTLPSRLRQHDKGKPWFGQVAHIEVEHYPSRAQALNAERGAIRSESPLHNVVHNGRHAAQWTFKALRGGYERTCELRLYPELEFSWIVGDYPELDGYEQLDEYASYVQRHYPEWLDQGVPIWWSVRGGDVYETAPFQAETRPQTFLDSFTWPVDALTGHRLDWFSLPVRNERFPEFAAALGWTPEALQDRAPLRHILASKGSRGAL